MANGWTGKILRVNLTTRSITTINTSNYEQWGGGHGFGSAIFWDMVLEPSNPLQSASNGWDMADAFDERNVVTFMTAPMSGTLAPAMSGRTEVQGVGSMPFRGMEYPGGWFTRSNFGGHFSPELKFAGWDGIILEGKASSPVWLKIINDEVSLEDAGEDGDNLWGLETYETTVALWRLAAVDNRRYGFWNKQPGDSYTTQRPRVISIGPAGENMINDASIVHGAGRGAGNAGFGGVLGSKNLKAISVVGTGSVEIANPQELMDARAWFQREKPRGIASWTYSGFPNSRENACFACPIPCSRRYPDRFNNESQCVEAGWHGGRNNYERRQATDLIQRLGINAYHQGTRYINNLYEMGIAGPGKEVDTGILPVAQFGTLEFAEVYARQMAYRVEGIGDAVADGVARFASNIGRWIEDTDSGVLKHPQWGFPRHHSLPTVNWSYGSLVGDRDVNEHNYAVWFTQRQHDVVPAATLVKMLSDKTIPFTGDELMMSHSFQGTDGSNMAQALEEGIYSEHYAKFVAWDRHWNRFYKQSMLECDWGPWPAFVNIDATAGDNVGTSPEAEDRFFNAVTGKNRTFTEGMEVGRKIFNLDRAVWILQGRHRDAEVFTGYVYTIEAAGSTSKRLPVHMADGTWEIQVLDDMFLDRDGVNAFLDNYYTLEGWEPSTGYPTRATLEGLGLGNVADVLQTAGKLA